MLTVSCVLKTGGDYDVRYVDILQRGVAKHLHLPHRFVCYSDVPVPDPCERIALSHDLPGWWNKILIFANTDEDYYPQLYLDLDTIITDSLDPVMSIPFEFAMLSIRDRGEKTGDSGVMWLSRPFPLVYECFVECPQHWMRHYKTGVGKRFGDQAYISDCFDPVPKLPHWKPDFFKSYRYDGCQERVPEGCSVVCFGGKNRPHNSPGWVKQAWV